MTPDGQFPNVTKTPNPEVPECLDRAERVATEQRADLVIATDPDADRLGGLASLSAAGGAPFRFLTGQELAALLTWFKLNRLAAAGDMPPSPFVVTTEVTTGQITRIGRQFGAQVVNDLLVGFKYHADVLWRLESEGRYGDVTGTPADFVIATEESHGVLATAGLRDKDSACAALLLAELALFLKRQGRTVPDLLDDLARQFGYFKNDLRNLVMTGVEGKRDMARMLDALRAAPPAEVGGLKVVGFEDLRDENGRMGPFAGDTDKAARNFLVFRLAGDGVSGKVCLRPSGTEPKAKAYIEASCEPPKPGTPDADWQATRAKVDAAAKALADDFVATALDTVKTA
jgi:phosphoglucomutase/phosphomannomutase